MPSRSTYSRNSAAAALRRAAPSAGSMVTLAISVILGAMLQTTSVWIFLSTRPLLGRNRGVKVVVKDWRGKGSHVKLHYGDRATFVKHGEIPKGLYHGMLRQLGLSVKDFD